MATRLTYTTGTRSPELDRGFESALGAARAAEPQPLAHLVAGHDADVGPVFAREDPSHRYRTASRAREGEEVAAAAVESARQAQRDWRRLPYGERLVPLRAAARLIDERKLELAAAISLEVGKVRTESIAEVESPCSELAGDAVPRDARVHGGVAENDDTIPVDRRQRRALGRRRRVCRHANNTACRCLKLPVSPEFPAHFASSLNRHQRNSPVLSPMPPLCRNCGTPFPFPP